MSNSSVPPGPRREVVLVDEVVRWVRRPGDLVSAVLALVGIGLVMLLAVYGSATTLAVTRDVRTATSGILRVDSFHADQRPGRPIKFLPAAGRHHRSHLAQAMAKLNLCRGKRHLRRGHFLRAAVALRALFPALTNYRPAV